MTVLVVREVAEYTMKVHSFTLNVAVSLLYAFLARRINDAQKYKHITPKTSTGMHWKASKVVATG